MRLTDLEREVLADVISGHDPWRGRRGGDSRIVSQTIGRLLRKGMIEVASGGAKYRPTAKGNTALEQAESAARGGGNG